MNDPTANGRSTHWLRANVVTTTLAAALNLLLVLLVSFQVAPRVNTAAQEARVTREMLLEAAARKGDAIAQNQRLILSVQKDIEVTSAFVRRLNSLLDEAEKRAKKRADEAKARDKARDK